MWSLPKPHPAARTEPEPSAPFDARDSFFLEARARKEWGRRRLGRKRRRRTPYPVLSEDPRDCSKRQCAPLAREPLRWVRREITK